MVAAGVLPLSHATDGGGSIRIPAGVNGNIGLKPSRGVFSIAPGASDLTGLVSTQGCQSRTVRDTAAFVDHCRGGAPGEFMPYWMPAEPYCELIRRDPGRLRIALSHEWGDYRATPHIVPNSARGADSSKAWATRSTGPCPRSTSARRSPRRPPATSATSRRRSPTCWLPWGWSARPPICVEPINIRIWEAGLHTSFTERARMQAVFNTTARAFGNFFESWDIILTPITALPTPRIGTTEYLTISDNPSVHDWFANLWRNFAYTPLANLCGIPAFRCRWLRRRTGCRWASRPRPDRPTTGCCCSWPRRSSARSTGSGMRDGCRGCM
jgi:amidase